MFKWLTVLLLTLCLPLVCSIDTPVYKQGETVNIKIPCLYNGTYCSNTTDCFITILNSADNVLVNNQQMSYGGSYFNYTFSNTNVSGDYKTQMVCTNNGVSGNGLFNFKITENGQVNDVNLVVPLVATIFIIIFFSVFGFLVQKNHPTLGIPLIVLSFVLLLFLAVQGRLMLDMNANIEKITDQMNFFYTFLIGIVSMVIVYVSGYMLLKWKDWMMEQKILKMGLKR